MREEDKITRHAKERNREKHDRRDLEVKAGKANNPEKVILARLNLRSDFTFTRVNLSSD